MYPILQVDSELYQKLQDKEDKTPCKTGPHHRIVPAQTCPECGSYFFARRKNQKYCSGSCRVMACNKRNNYIYKNGSYKKPQNGSQGNAIGEITEKQLEKFKLEILSGTKKTIGLAGIGESGIAVGIFEILRYLIIDRSNEQKLNEIISLLKSQKKEIRPLGSQPSIDYYLDDLVVSHIKYK